MNSLRDLCTRGLWVQNGRIVADGPMDRVIDEYLASTVPQAVSA
jgi:ABC-type polysaccharide/polyol phosphate transport system ATPase subunit